MAEKVIGPAEAGGNRFKISIDAASKANFPNQREVVLELPEGTLKKYDVVQKDIPVVLKGVKYKTKDVTWLNNFGLKKKQGSARGQVVDPYTVIFDAVPGAVEYVYYDGPADSFDEAFLHHLEAEVSGSKVRATLSQDDPAVGWTN